MFKVSDSYALEHYPTVVHPYGLKTSILGLRTTVHPQYFSQGSMRLKCVASLSPVLWQGDRESVVQSIAPHFLDKEALLLGK
ncbi:hypothetical protein O3M35_004580 [Rhynocoris fuscipes]|uniref:Uncharacterized protein n=1 Tax=Rhynocoris fuscipes TaxID=488301 RepID=A0AAW1CE68_9HEMI